ncbi:hypothetical protein FACS1894122_14540 [Alphaproteobacteria bacterium]|nr:hypothetical protein FACS1894122_14540 [Alphaproteobacteria bacterium]
MNYKNIIAFILLFFIQSVDAADMRPSWLEAVNREAFGSDINSYHKKVAKSYRDHNKVRIIIVGSGRGYWKKNDGVNNYAAFAYETPNNYLLVDHDNKMLSDIKAYIIGMMPAVFGANQYNHIIFEHVPTACSPQAIRGAFALLRKNGKIITPGIPFLESKNNPRFRYVKENCYGQFNIGGGTCFFLRRDRGMPVVFVDDTVYDACAGNELEFFKGCVQDFLKFFCLDSEKAKIEFTIDGVEPGTDMWPKRYIDICSPDEAEPKGLKMVITKLK